MARKPKVKAPVETAPVVQSGDTPQETQGEPGEKAVLPVVTKNYRDPITRAQVQITHDPNDGTFIEKTTFAGKVTVTKHVQLSHAWARLEEVK